jgi:hypothetical protein
MEMAEKEESERRPWSRRWGREERGRAELRLGARIRKLDDGASREPGRDDWRNEAPRRAGADARERERERESGVAGRWGEGRGSCARRTPRLGAENGDGELSRGISEQGECHGSRPGREACATSAQEQGPLPPRAPKIIVSDNLINTNFSND